MNLNPNYIINAENHKIAVQLDIETFNKIEEVLENYALYQFMQVNNDDDYLPLEQAQDFYKSLAKS
jgi:hypothetical protein